MSVWVLCLTVVLLPHTSAVLQDLSLGTVSEMSKVSFLTDDLVAQNDVIVFSQMRASNFMKSVALTDRVTCMHTCTHTHTQTHTLVFAQSHAHILILMQYLQDLKACIRI